jgi:hypothetical protein
MSYCSASLKWLVTPSIGSPSFEGERQKALWMSEGHYFFSS